jgi:hypothetical protein
MLAIVVFRELKEQASRLHSRHLEQRQPDDSQFRSLEVLGYLRICGELEGPSW